MELEALRHGLEQINIAEAVDIDPDDLGGIEFLEQRVEALEGLVEKTLLVG